MIDAMVWKWVFVVPASEYGWWDDGLGKVLGPYPSEEIAAMQLMNYPYGEVVELDADLE
jgi:hypothetical protein